MDELYQLDTKIQTLLLNESLLEEDHKIFEIFVLIKVFEEPLNSLGRDFKVVFTVNDHGQKG